jgi:hypothetical protein
MVTPFLAAALNYDAASAAATSIRDSLLPVTYFMCFLGFVEGVAKSRGDGERIIMSFLVIALIVIVTVNYPTAINVLRNAINGTMETNNAHVNNLFYQMVTAKLPDQPWVTDIGNYILYGIVKLLQGIGRVGIMLVSIIQAASLFALVAISPVLLGMLATSWTQSAGARFLMTSLIVCMWQIGVSLVDLVLYAVGQYIFAGALAAGGAAGAGAIGTGTAAGVSLTTLALPAIVLAMSVAAFVPIGLYLAVPIVMHAVMLGANPLTSVLSAGAGVAASAAAAMTAGTTSVIGTARTLARSGGTTEGSSQSTRQVPENGPIANATPSTNVAPPSGISDSTSSTDAASQTAGGVLRQASGAFAVASGATYSTAAAGSKLEAPGNTGMSAVQGMGEFSVTSSDGESRTFKGNIGNPHELAAAYNAMAAAKRQPSDATLPF